MAEPNITTITGKNAALNQVNDSFIGGGGEAPGAHPGQLGKTKRLTHAQAAQLSDTSIGTLFGGIYQYVLSKAGSTAAPARGLTCFWASAAKVLTYEVSPDSAGIQDDGRYAGWYINAPGKGNYCWIQVDGMPTVLCKSTVTTTTDGNAAVVDTTSNTIDSRADATGTLIWGGAQGVKGYVGVFLEAPANAGLKRILVKVIGRIF